MPAHWLAPVFPFESLSVWEALRLLYFLLPRFPVLIQMSPNGLMGKPVGHCVNVCTRVTSANFPETMLPK
jgi:hypothetical protein